MTSEQDIRIAIEGNLKCYVLDKWKHREKFSVVSV